MFHVGQKVVCVDDSPDALGRPLVVMKDHIYTVSSSFYWNGIPAILLQEVCPGSAPGWFAYKFRPITERKTDISIFKRLLVPGSKIVEPV